MLGFGVNGPDGLKLGSKGGDGKKPCAHPTKKPATPIYVCTFYTYIYIHMCIARQVD